MPCLTNGSHTSPGKDFFSVKLFLFRYPFALTCAFGVQKNRLIETDLLSTYNICFG